MYSRTQHPLRRTPHKDTHALPDWSKLSRNDAVTVLRPDGSAVSGHIDMIAVDRSVFWMIQDAGLGRIMICSAESPIVIKAGNAS
ncbi:hypothetical protein [Arthrobacter sp. 754]|uniref:hypothetical protein n=1 Tax=Arthrobacter sp. 754 TaxID=3156315 RepID=UPI0033985E6E